MHVEHLVGVLVAEALPMVAEAPSPGCGGYACFMQKQSQLLVIGLEFDNKKNTINSTGACGCHFITSVYFM